MYIDLKQYESALLTLNSCPMFTYNGKDAHRALTPAKVHLPFSKPIGEILPDRTRNDEDDVSCNTLPSSVDTEAHSPSG